MKSHYMRNKALHSCIEIAFLSSVNLYDTVRQLSSLWQLCLAFMLLLLLHATCHMSHGAYSSGIVCLIASFRSVLFSCTTRLLTNVQFIYAADSRQTLKDDSLPRPPSPCATVWHALKFNILTACTISSWNFCFITPRANFLPAGREEGKVGEVGEWGECRVVA